MFCIEILNHLGAVVGWEVLEQPVWVCRHHRNGRILRCDRNQAQGVMAKDGSGYYSLGAPLPGALAQAQEIPAAEAIEHLNQ